MGCLTLIELKFVLTIECYSDFEEFEDRSTVQVLRSENIRGEKNTMDEGLHILTVKMSSIV